MNIRNTGATRTVDIRLPGVFVDEDNTGSENGSHAHPWDTVAEGIDDVTSSGRNLTIRIAPGTYLEHGFQINGPCTLINSSDTGAVYIGP